MSTIIETSSGRVRGARAAGVLSFKGIPYAASPTGELRFAEPQRPVAWDGVRDASDYGPIAPQLPLPGVLGELVGELLPSGDDHLSLNVWRPDSATAGLPVLVWIHGGAFYSGSGAEALFDGSSFARQGIVCITLNYRLGVQGFCHLDGRFPGLHGTGNLGLLDQVAALQWVQENVSAFGGDPGQVCLAGESAGAMSVLSLMAMPAAQGLFHRAIAQSASIVGISAATADRISGYVLGQLGLAAGSLDGLRDTSVEALLAAQGALIEDLQATRDVSRFAEAAGSAMPFQPTYDTDVLPHRPDVALGKGVAADIPLLIGRTRDEAQIFLHSFRELFSEPVVRATVAQLFAAGGHDEAHVIEAYRAGRPDAEFWEVAAAVETDRLFSVPMARFADAQVAHQPDVWAYRFDWSGRPEWGAHHFVEVPFVFNTLDEGVAMLGERPPQALADAVHQAWVAFIRDGDPNHAGLPSWPRYDTSTRAALALDEEPHVIGGPTDADLAIWDEVYR